MKELYKYSNCGHFIFRINDRLSGICNAPTKHGGLYLIFALKGTWELVYIGISGRIEKNTGKLIQRKDGIKGRIANGKRDGEPRKNYWVREMIRERIDALKICWYVVNDEVTFKDCPKTIEREMINKYKPRWNRN